MAIVTTAIMHASTLLVSQLSLVLVFFTVLLAARFFYVKYKTAPMPPGPYGVPLLGYLPFVGPHIHKTFDRLSDKYGSIFSVNLGTKTIVVLTDPKLIRTCLSKEEFSDRPTTSTYSLVNRFGVSNVNGALWKQQRRFLHERLRNLGMKNFGPGREQMEHTIMSEVENLLQSLAVHNGQAIDPISDFKIASGNVMCSIMMSVRFEKENPVFKRFMELYYEGFQLFVAADISTYIPLVMHGAKAKNLFKKLQSNHTESQFLIKKYVDDRRKEYDPLVSRDLLDYYLHEERMGRIEGSQENRDDTRQILQVMNDLFSGGQETVTSALSWSFVHLILNKEVLQIIQQDLDTVVGRNRLPALADMPNLPYLEATIYEILRYSTILPLGAPHSISKDVFVNEFMLPKGTLVYTNLYSCLKNEKYWPNPEKFDPTRFLDKDLNVVKPSEFLAFGVGRRVCLGEILGRSEIFLFLSSILHVFNLEPSNNLDEYPEVEGITGVSHTPNPFKVCLVPREISVLSTKETAVTVT